MSSISLKGISLKQLKSKFENQEFAIPEIQRLYVWNKHRICNLMDSIFKNYPIGIGLVWKAKFSHAINIRPNNKTIIPPFNKRASHADLIIDGQQSLSSLYGVLFGISEKPEVKSFINFTELYFVTDNAYETRFIFSKRALDNSYGHIQLSTLLNTAPSILRKRLNLGIKEAKEAKKCFKAFHSYKFFLLTFEGLQYDEVREIFIRVNSAGMTVSRADTLFAKASNVDLRDHMLDTKRGLKYGYDKIPIDSLQNALGLAYGATKIGNLAFNAFLRKINDNKHKNKEFEKIWKKLQYGYQESVDFLVNTMGIKQLDLLPSQNVYSILSYFFFLNQSRAKTNQIREIKKWFWHTACGERYSGSGFNKNIPSDINFFQRLANNINTKYNVSEKISPIDFLKSNYKNVRASSSNAYFIMLRTKKPRYLLNGHEMLLDYTSSISNRKDRHHIFPYALLKRGAINEKWINSIANICYLESDENQSISDKHPKYYLAEYQHFKHFAHVMKSHLIPYDKTSPVWQRNFRKAFLDFVNIRGKLIITEIEKLAGGKIFEKLEILKHI
ncbi:MAG: DUF262 domain-containing protein [Bacteroidetes bacterium]|nr:DUF262 domain-containing protein [Bacteroidota bacterium]